MRIIIQGDNHIAVHLAVNLTSEEADIVLIGQCAEVIEGPDLSEQHEIHRIVGRCSDPALMDGLALDSEDTLISVADDDELNLVSCKLFADRGVARCLCRIRNARLGDMVSRNPAGFGITDIFRPEQLVEEQLLYLIQHPGAFQRVQLHDGLVQVLGVKARSDGPLVGKSLSEIPNLIPKADVRVAAIYTDQGPEVPRTGAAVVREGDDVFFVVGRGDEGEVIRVVHGSEQRNRRVFIVGGGNVGLMLAAELQQDYQVKVLEQDRERCDYLNEKLDDVIVLHGRGGDRDLLNDEYIDDVDVFCAVTNDDENNYLAALLAKKLGAGHVIALINDTAYVDLVEGRDIDIVLVPSQITLGALLGLARQGVNEARRLRRGAAEVLSIAANRKAVGAMVGDLPTPAGASIGAVVRGGKMLIAHRDTLIQEGDSLIVFLADVARLAELRRRLG